MLVVDDNRDAAQTLAAVLSQQGQEVQTSHDAREALRIAADFAPEIALLDTGLPDIDGSTVCRRLREQATRREPPLTLPLLTIACTGWGQPHDRARARKAGFDVHLVKPIEPLAVMQIVACLRASARAEEHTCPNRS